MSSAPAGAAPARLAGGTGRQEISTMTELVPNRPTRVWDPFVRVFHWSLVACVLLNFFVVDDGETLHIWLGYTATGLVMARIVWGFVGTRHARFADFFPAPARLRAHLAGLVSGRREVPEGHNPLGALMMLALMALVLGLGASGWMLTLDAYWGAEWLEERDGLYRRARPAWQLAAARPLFAGVELRASYFGRYETADSDDPLASWLRRGEFALALKPGGRLALAAGLACQVKENLLFENEERSRALFAEAVYDANAHTALVLRLDLSRTFKTVIDVRQATADVFVGLRARI